jgi:hypothetical protein
VWKHDVHVLGWLLKLEIWAYYDSTHKLRFPLQPDWRTLPLTRLDHYNFCLASWGSWVVLRHGPWSMSLLTPLSCTTATLSCMILVPVLLQPDPYTRKPHASIDDLERFGQDNGLNNRHLLQLPLQLTLSAKHCIACAATLS